MMHCTRPEWSHAENDYCPCDNPDKFNADLDSYYVPCEDCTWWQPDPRRDET